MTNIIEAPTAQLVPVPPPQASGLFTAAEMRERVNTIQEVMNNVMHEGTHYGTIPGTGKPSLYKPGAEVLCVLFRIYQEYTIEDLSTGDIARFRVRCIGRHQGTGATLGEGVGECSSGEEKYKWRKAICEEEFKSTPETLRRVKFSKYRDSVQKQMQVRTEAADMANTVLKMACKRAMVAMVLNTTAASDIFTQDIEDLPEGAKPAAAKTGDTDLLIKWASAAISAPNTEALREITKSGLAEIDAVPDDLVRWAFKTVAVAKSALYGGAA